MNCYSCPAGHDCSGGDEAVPCAPGTYNDGSLSTCTDCDANKYCDDPTSSNGNAQTCPSGTYSEGGLIACLECPPGSACNGGVKTACSGSGEWSLAGATTCQTLAGGTEKNDGANTATPQVCPAGYYTTGSGVCIICDDGSECDGENKNTCAGGALCPEGTSSSAACPDYQDCVNWSNNCAIGEKLSGGSCISCAKDEVCPLRGETTLSVTTGYYSPVDVNVEYICPGGYDCSDADNIEKCADKNGAAGYYSPEGIMTCT